MSAPAGPRGLGAAQPAVQARAPAVLRAAHPEAKGPTNRKSRSGPEALQPRVPGSPHRDPTPPGSWSGVDTFHVGALKGVWEGVYMQAATATAATPGLGSTTNRLPLTAVQLLNNQVLPSSGSKARPSRPSSPTTAANSAAAGSASLRALPAPGRDRAPQGVEPQGQRLRGATGPDHPRRSFPRRGRLDLV